MIDLLILSQITRYAGPGLFSLLFRIFGLGARSRRAAVTGLALYLLLALGVPLLLVPTLGYAVYRRYVVLIMAAANLTVFIVSSDGFLKTCFLDFCQMNVTYWLGLTVNVLRGALGWSYPTAALLLLACSAAIYVCALRYWAGPLRFMADTIQDGWLGLLAVPGCTVATGVLVAVWFGTGKNYDPAMMILTGSLLVFAFLMYLRGLYRSLAELARLSRERSRRELLENELSVYDDYLATARQARHDLRHHNAVLGEYLADGDLDGARRYLDAYNDSLSRTALTAYCENKTAAAVLRFFARRAAESGVRFAVKAEIPACLPLPDAELGTLLSNLLENAFNASRNVPEGGISLTAAVEDGALRLDLRNSVSGQVRFEGGMPLSERPDGGTGTKSAARIVSAAGGMLRFRQEEGEFVTQLVLPL